MTRQEKAEVMGYARKINELQQKADQLERLILQCYDAISIAASYDPDEWPTVGLKTHCIDCKVLVSEIKEKLKEPSK